MSRKVEKKTRICLSFITARDITVECYQGEAEFSWDQLVERVGEDQLANIDCPDLSYGAKMTANLSEESLTKMIANVVMPVAAELHGAGHLHYSDYYNHGIQVVGGNFGGMTRLLCDTAVLLMNGVPKDTVLRAVTPYFVEQDCPRQLVTVVVDQVDAGLNPFRESFDLAAEFRRHEKLLNLSWFQMTVAEFVAKHGSRHWWTFWR